MHRWLVVFLGLLFLPSVLFAKNIPKPQGWVNDFANVISSEYRDKLTVLIQELEEKTSTEVAVVTVESIAPYDEKEFARLLFDNWKPGKIGKDNGVLVILAIKERRWRIETGYGVEGILPDGLCGEIGRNYMVPYFKEGKYGEGLYQGVVKIAGIVSQDIKPEAIGTALSEQKSKGVGFSFLVLVLIVTLFYILPWKLIFILFILSCLYIILLKAFLLLWLVIPIFLILCFFKLLDKGSFAGTWSGGYGGGGFGGGGFGGGGFGGGGGGGGGAGGGF